ncbi:ABC transporter permease [Actinoplanes ianthinogenes]|uniref:ABC transporter permease n=1 Tax=Actinoplanes ianthinogenes TaxID=122358 RepID=A0ABM7LXR1_9ACTN|nr:ABC transporter permease [Actinoplanes ianthinogenes]BCJ44121.1 ABC transporter permease [Actinoplanes ianthinogenes]GGQ95925.1 ABC transporter permease [Actinoplanes ianthinogenes]
MWRDLWDEALAGVLARPGRTALTALGTVLGTATLVITTGLADTAGAQIVSRFDELAATTVTVAPTPEDGPQARESPIPWDAPARLSRLNGVEAAATMTTLRLPDAKITATTVVDPLAAKGAAATVVAGSPELAAAVEGRVIGRFFDAGHDRRADRVAVVGRNLANSLHLADLRQRPAIFVGSQSFTVIGVLVDTRRNAGLLDAMILPEGTARRVFGLKAPESVVIDTAVGAAALIASQAPVALAPQKPELLTAERPPEPTTTKAKVAEDVRALFVLLGVISLVVGGVGIANTTLVSVLERIGEIGLRRSLGGTRFSVASLFILESSMIGLIGGILGSSAGILAVVLVGAVKQWTPVLNIWIMPAAVLVGAVVGLLAGLYPSLRAAKIEPIAALRAQA